MHITTNIITKNKNHSLIHELTRIATWVMIHSPNYMTPLFITELPKYRTGLDRAIPLGGNEA